MTIVVFSAFANEAHSRNQRAREELNTQPRTTYLAAVLNPNPELPETQPEQNL